MAGPISVLQFGTTGQLARALAQAVQGDSSVFVRALARREADFQYPQQVAEAVRRAGKIDVVINATAYTAVDKAESERDLARTVNATSVATLAQACRLRGVPLIHVSTDYVFDGSKSTPYVETDATNPIGVYGRTKLDGEDAIRTTLEHHVIVRTSWVYSAQGANFVRTMLRLGAERDELRVVDDQRGTPTSTSDLARAIWRIASQIASSAPSEGFGTFHYSNEGETTWRRFAEAIFHDAPWANVKARVVPITTAEYPTPARRPLNSRLDCAKIERVYAVARSPWRDALRRILSELEMAQRGST